MACMSIRPAIGAFAGPGGMPPPTWAGVAEGDGLGAAGNVVVATGAGSPRMSLPPPPEHAVKHADMAAMDMIKIQNRLRTVHLKSRGSASHARTLAAQASRPERDARHC